MQLVISLILFSLYQISGWELFEKTRFKWEYDDEIGFEVQMPTFDKGIKELEGKEITISGHYLPLELDYNRIIISKLPYASCFFCGGGGGPESVAEVVFSGVQRPFRMDEIITVKGILKLNPYDYEHMVFMIVDAKEIEI